MLYQDNKCGDDLFFLEEKHSFWALAGHKAGNLARLWGLGFRIPAGFAVPLNRWDTDFNAILDAVQQIGGFPVAVRSSGSAEDSEGASFAGQFESFLNVSNPNELKIAMTKCHSSFFSQRVSEYSQKVGVLDDKEKEHDGAILVQKMVAASVSGVLFSIDPVSGNEFEGVIEATEGLGQDILNGSKTPSTYWIHLRDGRVKKLHGAAILNEDLISELREVSLRIQAVFGQPQDIEWAADEHGVVFILQARPITKINWRTDVTEFSNAYFRDGGVSARVCTPLMASLYEHAFQDAMQEYASALGLIGRNDPYHWIDTFYGRPYWNAADVKRSMCKVPGFKERDFDLDIGVKKQYGPDGPRVIPTNLLTVLRAIPIAMRLGRSFAKQEAKIKRIQRDFARDSERYLSRIKDFADQSDSVFFRDLKDVIANFHYQYEKANFTMAYVQSNAQSELHTLVTRIDKATDGKTDLLALMSGFPESGYHLMQMDLTALQRLAHIIGMDSEPWMKERNSFLKRYFFRGDAELDISVPRWSEDVTRFDKIIAGLLSSRVEPIDIIVIGQRQYRQYLDEKNAVVRRIKAKSTAKVKYMRSFLAKLERARRFLFLREEMREISVKSYYIIRQYAEEAGKRLVHHSLLRQRFDVYMLRDSELAGCSATSVPAPAKEILFRRQMYEGYRNLVPPADFGYSPDEDTKKQDQTSLTMFAGTGCSRGVIEGVARVILYVDDAVSLQAGEILVTQFTDPGWTPALGVAVGVVTEIGGLLSHAAVIAREFGIPAVLNVSDATKRIRTGQRIRLDGEKGLVWILEERTPAKKSDRHQGQPSSRSRFEKLESS